MNPVLVTSFWRQRLTSPIRVVLLGLAFGFPLLGAAFMHAGLSSLGDSVGITLIFAVGMIGQDVSSGVLQLLFARPVRRIEYVVSRWLAVGTAAAAVGLLQVLIAWAILSAYPNAPTTAQLGMFVGSRVLECFGIAAVFTMLSCLIGGVGDLAIYFVGTVLGGVLELVAQTQHWTVLSRAASELAGFLTPKLNLATLAATSPLPFFPIVSFVSTIALCLVVAVAVMNRKELSYASG